MCARGMRRGAEGRPEYEFAMSCRHLWIGTLIRAPIRTVAYTVIRLHLMGAVPCAASLHARMPVIDARGQGAVARWHSMVAVPPRKC